MPRLAEKKVTALGWTSDFSTFVTLVVVVGVGVGGGVVVLVVQVGVMVG